MESRQENINFSDYFRAIKSRKGVVFTFFFITVCAVTAGSFLMKPVYRATTTLLIDLESPNVLTTTGSVALGSTSYNAYKEYFKSQSELITSRGIANQVFEEFGLDINENYVESKDPIREFLATIKVEPVRDTRLLLLHVDNKRPKLAADIANRMAEIYVERNLAYITKSEVINLLKNEYLKLQTKLSEYSKIYKGKHPKMLRLEREIAQMAEKIKEENKRTEGYDLANPSSSDISGSVLAGLKANNVTIQDRAEVPPVPLKPKKRLNIALSVIVGLFGGIGMALFFEHIDDTVKSAEDTERLFDWPFLGNVPKIRGRMTELERDLFVKIRPMDPVSEAYRAIRTSVSTKGYPLKSIIITSPGPREGKTTTLCNLGTTLAGSGKNVLLVDADMRKPRLHEAFKEKNEKGLSDFLSGQAKFDGLLNSTEVNNLTFIPGGQNSPNPSELLASQKMKDFIDIARERFDFILFDTPPIAVVTDAVILSQLVDGTILVIESGKTHRRILSRVNKLLKDARARVLGTILNKISVSRSSYHYYSYYK